MSGKRLGATLPYALLLAAAVWLFMLAGQTGTTARPGQLGPDAWPRAALLLMAAVCVFQIARAVVGRPGREVRGLGDNLDEGEDEAPRRPALLVLGIALTVAYSVLVTTLGFPLATTSFLVAFMYLGGSRSHLAIWLSSLIGVGLISFLLLRVVYVSLPRGIPPFDRVVDFIVSGF